MEILLIFLTTFLIVFVLTVVVFFIISFRNALKDSIEKYKREHPEDYYVEE